MKNLISYSLLLCLILSYFPSMSAITNAGNNVSITQTTDEDLYLAGDNISVDAIIRGDVLAAGSEIQINDSVYGDAILAGGEIDITGFITDDIRIAGGDIDIVLGAGDDIIIFGGEVTVHEEAIVGGDIIVFGGDVRIYGNVKGSVLAYAGSAVINGNVAKNLEVKGGSISIDAAVSGDAILAAGEIDLGTNAEFSGNVRYWTKDGEMDFGAATTNAEYDSSLELDDDNQGWSAVAGLIGFSFFSLLSSLLLAFILIMAFGRYFAAGAEIANREFLKSFGFGALYVVVLPVAIVISFITVIGIPLGLLTLLLYLFTLVFAPTFAAVLISNWVNQKYDRSWNKWMIFLVSAGSLIVLWLLMAIPFVGWLIGIILIGTSFGGLLMAAFKKEEVIPSGTSGQ